MTENFIATYINTLDRAMEKFTQLAKYVMG